jgi:hypothetical protein
MSARRSPFVLVVALASCYVGRNDPRVALQQGHASSEARTGAFAPCGTPLAEVDGVWAYSNDVDTGSARACAGRNGDGALSYQSLELAQRWMHEAFGIQPLWNVQVAAQMCDPGRYPEGVLPYLAGEATPQKGDLAVWRDGGVGHVAIVSETLEDALVIVEQNATAEGTRRLAREGDRFVSEWDTAPDCFVRAEAAWDEPLAPGPADGPSDDPSADPSEDPDDSGDDTDATASCSALGSAGACTGDTLVWDDAGTCRVRDCASEDRSCIALVDGGWGCSGGKGDASTVACESVGFAGACMADDTLVWVEDLECTASS